MSDTAKVGHPKGLYLLFTVEMWERLSYYGMRALLVLYMVSATTDKNPGFGFDPGDATKIYGWYTGLVYATPLLGGYLSDRFLGQRKAIYIGGVLMMIGHFLMAVPGLPAFYAALLFLIIGNGFFKPNISTMVGGLYDEKDPRRDGAFTIFYMGINLGAVLSPLVCGTLGEKVSYHWGFGSAGIGMLIGLLTFWWGEKRFLPDNVGVKPAPVTKETGPVAKEPLTRTEIDRLAVILVLCVFVMFFWAAFEQAGGLMNLYTKEKVDRMVGGWEVPATWFQSVNPAIIFIFAIPFSMLWTALGRRGIDPPTPVKMGFGLILLSFGFVFMMHASNEADAGMSGRAALFWVIGAYFWHTMGELCLSPIGLSMVTKLAPARMVSLMMGVWFGSNFVANLAAGYIGAYSEKLGEFELFSFIVMGTAGAGMILFLMSRPLVRLMHLDSEGDAWGMGPILGVVALSTGVLIGYPMLLKSERQEEAFKCAAEQREAKANLWRIYDAQYTYRGETVGEGDAAKERGTFAPTLDALGFSPKSDDIDFTQREIVSALNSIYGKQRELWTKSSENVAERRYETDLEKLYPKADRDHLAYTMKMTGDGTTFNVVAIRKDGEPKGFDGRDLAGDKWTLNDKGHVYSPTTIRYRYRLIVGEDKAFVAEARRLSGTGGLEGDTFTLDESRNLRNITGGCANHKAPPPEKVAVEQAIDAANEATEDAKEVVEDAKEAVEGAVEGAADAAADAAKAVEGAAEAATDAAKEVAGDVEDAAKEATDGAKDAAPESGSTK